MNQEYAIEIINLTKFYGTFKVLDRINLKVEKGQIYGLVGPNGAGKTTLIKTACGILKPTFGKIKIMGYDVWKDPINAKSLLGYVPEIVNIYPSLTVLEFLHFIGKFCKIPREIVEERIWHYAHLFDLEKYMNTIIEDLSKGYMRRVALVSAFIRDPQVYLLDEPFADLDPRAIWTLRKILQKEVKNGKTVFLASHVLELVEKIAEKIAIINKGRIIASGCIEELKEATREKRKSLEELFLELT